MTDPCLSYRPSQGQIRGCSPQAPGPRDCLMLSDAHSGSGRHPCPLLLPGSGAGAVPTWSGMRSSFVYLVAFTYQRP